MNAGMMMAQAAQQGAAGMGGMLIPILDVSAIAERKPDYLLVLAWNFFDEIRQQLAEYEAGGGRFILPIPFPHIVGEAQTRIAI